MKFVSRALLPIFERRSTRQTGDSIDADPCRNGRTQEGDERKTVSGLTFQHQPQRGSRVEPFVRIIAMTTVVKLQTCGAQIPSGPYDMEFRAENRQPGRLQAGDTMPIRCRTDARKAAGSGCGQNTVLRPEASGRSPAWNRIEITPLVDIRDATRQSTGSATISPVGGPVGTGTTGQGGR